MTHCLRPLLLLAMLYQFTPGPPAAAKTVKEIVTPTGVLVVDAVNSQAFAHEFKVTLAGQTVLHTIEGDAATPFPNFPEPTVIRYVAEPIGPYDAVVIFQQFSSGNACNGGPIWFLGISKDGRFAISPPIDFCGGRSPRIMIDRGVIHVEFPVDEKDLPSTDARRSQSEEWTFSEKGLARIR